MGLISARGEYVIFFDSDDLMSEDCLSSVYMKARDMHADVLAFGFDVVDWSGQIISRFAKTDTSICLNLQMEEQFFFL